MKPSILRNLLLTFVGFGLMMGVVFPLYAQLFVEWRPGMKGWFITGCLVAGATIGVVNYWLVNWILLSKLRRISEVANTISRKDLTLNCSMESHDVIGEIIASFNRMAHTLRALVEEVRHSVTLLNDEADGLSAITSHTTQQVQRQQKQTDQALHALAGITTRTHEVSNSATEAALSAQRANENSSTGRRVVNATVDTINRLAGAIEEASTVIDTLQRQSEGIGSVLEVIRGIAEQTNLLALNAAIEAARAGESGRGFAVVADEVRSLASRTQQSTREIQEMIERLQSGAASAVNVMQQSRQQAQQSVEQAAQAGNTLETIANAVAGINAMNSNIASAAEGQRSETEVVNQSMRDIAEIAEESVNSARQVVASSHQLGTLAGELRTLVAEYKI